MQNLGGGGGGGNKVRHGPCENGEYQHLVYGKYY